MDESKVIEWVDLNLEKEMYRFSLQEWRISVKIGKPEAPFSTACVHTQSTRQRADIIIDPFEIAEESDLKSTIQHELMHLVCSPYNTLRDMALALAPQSAHEAIDLAWDDACEMTVRNMEKMLRFANEVAIDEYEQEIEDGKGDVDCETGNPRKRDKKRKRR